MTGRIQWRSHGALWLLIVLIYYPILFVILNSFKTNKDFALHPFGLPNPVHLENYWSAFSGTWVFIKNTVGVAVITDVLVLVLSSLAAYAFARFSFVGKRALFAVFLGLLMIPGTLTIIPMFFEVKSFGLLGTQWALILPYVANGLAISIFILRSFFDALPEGLFEAGRIDGASELYLFLRIGVPLSLPILGAVAILETLHVWGDYLWPVVALGSHSQFTISAGINYYAASFGTVENTGSVFASYVIASVPVVLLVILTMRTYISGLTSGALKA